jgi:hypothetical protein
MQSNILCCAFVTQWFFNFQKFQQISIDFSIFKNPTKPFVIIDWLIDWFIWVFLYEFKIIIIIIIVLGWWTWVVGVGSRYGSNSKRGMLMNEY